MKGPDKSAVLAAERLEPYTAAEHAAAAGRAEEYARDVPHTCICTWQWHVQNLRYERIRPWPWCPWHPQERTAQ